MIANGELDWLLLMVTCAMVGLAIAIIMGRS